MSGASGSSNLPTRQQLEEIDALLKRMLALPPQAAEARGDLPPPRIVEYSPPPSRSPIEHDSGNGDPVVQAWRVQWPGSPGATGAPVSTTSIPPGPAVAASSQHPSAEIPGVVSWGNPVMPTPVYHPPVASAPTYGTAPAGSQPAMPTYLQPVTSTHPPIGSPQASAVPVGQSYGPFFPIPGTPAAIAAAANAQQAATDDRPPRSSIWLPFVILNTCFDVVTLLLGPLGAWLRDSGRRWMGRIGIALILVTIGYSVGQWYGIEWPKIDWNRIDLSRFGFNR